jgi:hypothetical protein
MAKGRKEAPTMSELDSAMADIVHKLCGDNGSGLGDSDFVDRTLVIPLPALVLEWYLGVDGWPLSRSVSVAAEYHVGKTAFLTDIVRWHRLMTGRGIVACTEGDKDSPTLRQSILNYDLNAMAYDNFGSVEDWQKHLTNASKKVMALFKSKPELTSPVCFGTDSVVGALCRNKIKGIWEDGHASADFATEAKLYGDWLRTFTNMALAGNPFTFVGTSHIYEVANRKAGLPAKIVVSGGIKQLYAAAISILMKHVKKIDYVNLKGQIVNFSLLKNTLAGTRHYNRFDCGLYWTKGEDGVQHTWWDWDEATIWLLSDREMFPAKGASGESVVAACNIRAVSGGLYFCKELGVSEDDAMSASELGRVLNTKPEVLENLRTALKIQRHNKFIPGIEYKPVALAVPVEDDEIVDEAGEVHKKKRKAKTEEEVASA